MPAWKNIWASFVPRCKACVIASDASCSFPFLCWLNSSHASANKAITEGSYYPLNYSTLACAGVEEGKVKMRNAISSKPSTAKFRPSSQGAFGKRHEEWL